MIELSVSQTITAEGTRRLMTLKTDAKTYEVFFDLIGEFDVPPPLLLDGFVSGIILFAMNLREDIRVHGPMSRRSLYNLYEFQEIWHVWVPEKYKHVNIEPDSIVEAPAISGSCNAIAAFSGGVDSVFTLLRHKLGWLGNGSLPISAGLLVHGFDVPLSETAAFDKLRERLQPLAEELGISFRVIRTNLRDALRQKWEENFMAHLSCCLHQFSHDFPMALVGSSQPYSALVEPDGSHPMSDHLLSSGTMQIIHDAAAYLRTEKAGSIGDHATASRVLKVCWEGKDRGENCGVCEKCMRTRMNFSATGHEQPPCFTTPMDLSLIPSIPIRTAPQYSELECILTYAQQHNINKPWVEPLNRRLRKYRMKQEIKTLAKKIPVIYPLYKRYKYPA